MIAYFSKSTLFVMLITLFVTGCEFSTANIQEVKLAKDNAGAQPASEFDPTDTVYALVTLANAPDSTQLKAMWTAVDLGEAAESNQLIDEIELEAGSGTHTFNLSPTAPFPIGSYKVDVFLDDELNTTLSFTIVSEVAAATAVPTTELPTTEAQADEPAEPQADKAAPTSGAIGSLEDVREATVRIIAQGSFMSPEYGQVENVAGQGSGFIIDPEGIAVTNNHVVTGAALLNVYLEGESQPRNAKVLGVSECSDLAVIDIEGDGFPYLDWHEGPINVGLDMYLAGFPLAGNEEFTLNRGIISKENADGETPWSSVDAVLEYDATSNGGNSGGPVVTEDGQVLAVHYAGYNEARQAFGISSAVARDVVEQLRLGDDLHAIGVNGQAIRNEDGSIVGVWVSSVASGSPADQTGLQGGDIITNLEGLALSTDGTMSDYCDILRSHESDDVLSIEVLRLGTGEFYAGQLNGDKLELAGIIDLGVAQGDSYAEYVTITDDTGLLQVDIPAVWSEVNGSGWVFNDGTEGGLGLVASPDIDAYYETWTMPGMFFGATDNADMLNNPQSLLDDFNLSDSCAYDGRFDYNDALYAGGYDVWSNCGGEGVSFVNLVALPEDGSFLMQVQVLVASTADQEALDTIMNTFQVVLE